MSQHFSLFIFTLFQWNFSLFPIITAVLRRIDFLKNNDPVEQQDIVLRNPLDCKEKTVSLLYLVFFNIVGKLEKESWKMVRKQLRKLWTASSAVTTWPARSDQNKIALCIGVTCSRYKTHTEAFSELILDQWLVPWLTTVGSRRNSASQVV